MLFLKIWFMVCEMKYFNRNLSPPEFYLNSQYFLTSFIYVFNITYMLKHLAESEL